ncbi:MAG TPA: CHAT domain-containing protein [Thermoanaerobaculia bacterium]|nr:CHAT domain-containing protein [Thermoanaerobaculia bacterium]
MNDLAAGYVLRAQQEDRQSDLLDALDAAQHAVAATPRSAEALFNLARIEENIGLTTEAITSWNEFLKAAGSTRIAEARECRDLLLHRIDPTTQWDENRTQLRTALRKHDRPAIARLISPFPSSAERYLEEELLRPEHIDEAKTLASELARLTTDRYVVDVVVALERSPDALQTAHLAFANARRADRELSATRAAAYENAAQLLERRNSPLSLSARLGYATIVAFSGKPDALANSSALLIPIEQEARRRGFNRLLARVHATDANFLRAMGRYVESLSKSEDSLTEYEKGSDPEGVADSRMRTIGTLRSAGQSDVAWRAAMRALRESDHLVETRARHTLFGELALTAVALDHAPVALLYENTALRIIQHQLFITPPEQTDFIAALQTNLSIVRRARAEIELRLGDNSQAASDLAEGIRLRTSATDKNTQRALLARMKEVQAQAFIRINPTGAIASFTDALALTIPESRTYRASLLAQRADAQRRAGRREAAEADLRAALKELHAEQLYMLEHRKRGQAENMWSSYFSRFGEAYQSLIRQLVENGQTKDAFDYAEQARAFEPLYLVSEIVPNDFDGRTKGLAEIQEALPPGTQLIEYSVMPDQTIVWLVSREDFSVIRLPAGKVAIERHASELQRAVGARNHTAFEANLYALYDVLMAAPLASLKSKPQRLVIVPDGPMHGLPFAALRNPNTKRYLIEDVTIEIAGSANLYLVSLARDRALQSAAAPSVLLVGDPAFNENLAFAHGLQPLPRARSECERISEFYKPRAHMLLQGDATIPRFLEDARGSAIIHIAAHSVVNAQAPSRSYILLAAAANEPGPLEAQALLTRLSLDHTRLVVLSTCSSAGGLPIGAEGVAPFVRPLIGAGVPAVIGTLWNVEDATAEDLLVSFHRHYREGYDAAVALRLAQIGLLTKNNHNPGPEPVFAWAPFQVIGHASSPFAPSPQHKEKPP